MHLSLSEQLSQLTADVCIVGAGAAGITLARSLTAPGRRIILLEGGGLSYDSVHQEQNSGAISIHGSAGLLHKFEDYLLTSRLSYFGGSTNHWSNYCRPLDPIDFAQRSWVPDSGWPLTHSELIPYYEKAYPICGVPPFSDYSELAKIQEQAERIKLKSDSQIVEQIYHIKSPATNFALEYGQDILQSPDTHLVTDAVVTDFATDSKRRRILSVTARSAAGHRVEVRARTFVLAAGGIENARSLLLNQAHLPHLLNRDLIGAYFMEHAHIDIGRVIFARLKDDALKFYDVERVDEVLTVLCLRESVQEELKILNGQIDIDPAKVTHTETKDLAFRYSQVVRKSAASNPFRGRIRFIMETAPLLQNRIKLLKEKDSFQRARVKLDLHVSEIEWRTMKAFLDIFTRELGSEFQGRVKSFIQDAKGMSPEEFKKRFLLFGNHHMGTTRMHESAKQGVVDRNLKLHGSENLYLAGSSTFPSAGHAPPTLTIVALTLRLADHLKKEGEI